MLYLILQVNGGTKYMRIYGYAREIVELTKYVDAKYKAVRTWIDHSIRK